METRYTIFYWYHDEHDQLQQTYDTLGDAVYEIQEVLKDNYKDYIIVGRHYVKRNDPFRYHGKTYNDWKWELIDDFIEYYDEYGNKQK